jgi:hypothetical protein
VAGRVQRHVGILREVAHEISPASERTDKPLSAHDAHERFNAFVGRLGEAAPRFGLGVPTRDFVDHISRVTERYGANLFTCFDDPRIPATTNAIEGFFGAVKRFVRRTLGTGKTSGSLAQNLGALYLTAFAFATAQPQSALLEHVAHTTPAEFHQARRSVREQESTATLRRARRRAPDDNLDALLKRWAAT